MKKIFLFLFILISMISCQNVPVGEAYVQNANLPKDNVKVYSYNGTILEEYDCYLYDQYMNDRYIVIKYRLDHPNKRSKIYKKQYSASMNVAITNSY